MHYDYIILGGGIAGLYSALRLEAKFPTIKILILEKNAYLGGRTRMETFHSHKVVTGAGVGRFPKDKLLQKLVEASTGDPVQPVKTLVSYQFQDPCYTLKFIESLKKQTTWIRQHRSTHNFKKFFLRFFSEKEYHKFCESNGFTDFEHADIVDTLYDYGFEDNVPGNHIFPIDWNRLVKHLRKQLDKTTVRLDSEVVSYERLAYQGGFKVLTSKKKQYTGKHLIFAGFVDKYPFPEVRAQIGYNRFLRMYSYSRGENDHLHQGGMTYYDNTLQKSIYISPTIRTLSYSDNDKADAVMRLPLPRLKEMAGYEFDDVVKFYWEHGTHYYKPLSTTWKDRDEFIRYAQNPEAGIYLVGECISKNQGWTEGALESVRGAEHLWK
jgi:hypothetical protein